MIHLVVFFWDPDDQRCSLRVLLGSVVWGPKSYFWGFLKQIKFFFSKKNSNDFNIIHREKSLKNNFYGGEIKG
jgi:hypothetical protein